MREMIKEFQYYQVNGQDTRHHKTKTKAASCSGGQWGQFKVRKLEGQEGR